MATKNIHDFKEVEGKEVFFIRIQTEFDDWICAYARLPNFCDEDYETPHTYHADPIVGVDTAHQRNVGMSIEEKEADAINQIKECILHWRSLD